MKLYARLVPSEGYERSCVHCPSPCCWWFSGSLCNPLARLVEESSYSLCLFSMALSLCECLCVQFSSFYNDSSHAGLMFHLMISTLFTTAMIIFPNKVNMWILWRQNSTTNTFPQSIPPSNISSVYFQESISDAWVWMNLTNLCREGHMIASMLVSEASPAAVNVSVARMWPNQASEHHL